MRIEIDGDPWTVTELHSQSPSARGGATLIKSKLRNIRTGQLVQKTFKTGDRIIEPHFEIRAVQYLYNENETLYYFMDLQTFEQFPMAHDDIEYELGFMRMEDEVRALMHDGKCIGIEVPNTVELEITECEPSVRGDTVNAVTKTAKLETGIDIQVPMFIEQGQKVVVDTREARYLRRA